jgi:hypothetical protein
VRPKVQQFVGVALNAQIELEIERAEHQPRRRRLAGNFERVRKPARRLDHGQDRHAPARQILQATHVFHALRLGQQHRGHARPAA